MKTTIKLNDLLNLNNLENVKIRFNTMFDQNWTPIEIYKNKNFETLLNGHYWNYNKNKSYKEGQITIGFIKIDPKDDLWLLFHIGEVTKDLDKLNGVGYEYKELDHYNKYFGRLIVRYKNKVQTLIRKAESVIDECDIEQILPDTFDNDIFPGYDNINLSWDSLSRIINKENWKTALQNQKGVYLIIDTSNGKKYVGSAYGQDMILGRWMSYVKNGHGGNVGMKSLNFDHIKKYFRYSILDIYKSSINDNVILERESWWKELLLSRTFGYNEN